MGKMQNWIKEAFDSDSIPKKNIALRMAFDEIERLQRDLDLQIEIADRLATEVRALKC